MAAVVDIAPPQPAATPSFRRLRAASRALEWLFAGLFAVFIAIAGGSLWILWLYQGTLITVGPRGGWISTTTPPPDFIPFRAWPLAEKLAYTPDVLFRAAPTILLFWCLRSLFQGYGRGQVFTARNAGLIQAMGVCLIVDAAAPFLCHLILSATGYEIDRMWAHMAALQELVLGAVVFVVALVMQAGHEIEEDREGFV
ncbi:DUF2975 domain-containing protein [Phenylobacterium sp.]|uniref:DUF2975 domain-containing protein n=1 Tax=Phenylobacterium sp. TaxID=1871053 RepID=UPI002C01C004|nr:DUF2975 domain-containing protein [Phenylobacterium sp.]HLZ76166.1 DUF2975 domain-containing protein [Phenylobacterium sp.]